jgi:hypothetical protein
MIWLRSLVMTSLEMIDRAKKPQNFGSRWWQNGYADGISGVSPRSENEEYLDGYSRGYITEVDANN